MAESPSSALPGGVQWLPAIGGAHVLRVEFGRGEPPTLILVSARAGEHRIEAGPRTQFNRSADFLVPAGLRWSVAVLVWPDGTRVTLPGPPDGRAEVIDLASRRPALVEAEPVAKPSGPEPLPWTSPPGDEPDEAAATVDDYEVARADLDADLSRAAQAISHARETERASGEAVHAIVSGARADLQAERAARASDLSVLAAESQLADLRAELERARAEITELRSALETERVARTAAESALGSPVPPGALTELASQQAAHAAATTPSRPTEDADRLVAALEAAASSLRATIPAPPEAKPTPFSRLIAAAASTAITNPPATSPETDEATPTPDAVGPATSAAVPTPDAVVPATSAAVPTPDAVVPATNEAAPPEAVVPATHEAAPTPDAVVPDTDERAAPVPVAPAADAVAAGLGSAPVRFGPVPTGIDLAAVAPAVPPTPDGTATWLAAPAQATTVRRSLPADVVELEDPAAAYRPMLVASVAARAAAQAAAEALATVAAPAPGLRRALVALAQEDSVTAGALLAGLLPAQGAVLEEPLSYDLTVRGFGTFAVTVGHGGAEVQRLTKRRPRKEAAFHISGEPQVLAELLAGDRTRLGRFRPSARITGRRRRAKALRALPASSLSLAAAAAAGARLEPSLIYAALPYAVAPEWTRGHVFTVAQEITDLGPRAWYVTARDGVRLSVVEHSAGAAADATVTMSRAAFDRLLKGEPAAPGDLPVIRGDRTAVAALKRWTDLARA